MNINAYIHIYTDARACTYTYICKSKCGNLEARGATKTKKSSKVKAPETSSVDVFVFEDARVNFSIA